MEYKIGGVMKNTFTFLFVALCGFLILSSCKSHGTDPVAETYKDPREMTWIVDTLQYENTMQTNMNSILAFSSKDIFIYGHSSDLHGRVYHYDGNKWLPVDIYNSLGGTYYSPHKMISFNNNSIWLAAEDGNYKSRIIRYDGTSWTETATNQSVGGMMTITGKRNDNLYAAGRNGDILYFNGIKWDYDNIKIKPESGGEYFIKSSATFKDTVFFSGSMWGTTKNIFYQMKGTYKNWNIIDSMVLVNPNSQYKFGDWDFYVTPSNRLLSFGSTGIWEYRNNSYTSLLSVPYCINGMFAISDSYMMAVGDRGYAYFYDGTKWNLIQNLMSGYEDILYQAVWGDGKEMFIIGYTWSGWPQKTIVLHGK
jgi:hypothetical protein